MTLVGFVSPHLPSPSPHAWGAGGAEQCLCHRPTAEFAERPSLGCCPRQSGEDTEQNTGPRERSEEKGRERANAL